MSRTLPFDPLREPDYPETHERARPGKRAQAEIKARQDGLCALCGIKPKRWVWDHIIPLWKSGTNDTDNIQGLGSEDECECHAEKTKAEAAERAAMNRARGKTGQLARRKKRGGSSIKSNPKIPSRPMQSGKGFSSWTPEGFKKPLSKERRREVLENRK